MPIPPYVARLREQVGRELLWLPGATAVVLRDDEVLLVRRSDNGRWTPVTGIVDPGEHPAETAVRECLEEAGVTCEVEGLVWVQVLEEMAYDNGDRAQYLDHVFRCRYVGGEAYAADDESSEVGWFALDALSEVRGLGDGMRERIEAAVSWDGGAARI